MIELCVKTIAKNVLNKYMYILKWYIFGLKH